MYLDEIKCIWAEKKFAQQYDNWDDKVNGDSIPKRGKVTEIIVVVFVATSYVSKCVDVVWVNRK